MKLQQLIEKSGWEVLSAGDLEQEVSGGFSGDLLSWVMGHGEPQMAWITVQTHLNVIAVAMLREFSCLILAENAAIEEETLARAKEEGLTVLRSPLSAFESCRKLIEAGL